MPDNAIMTPSIITPGALCFDIGAHHGETADKFLNHYGAGRVVSVEPSLHNFLHLVQHWLNDPRVVPIHAAVLSHPGLVSISRASNQDGLTTIHPDKWASIYPDAGFEPPELIAGITLGQLIAKFGVPDHLKVDVEGAELEVLKGLVEVQQRPRLVAFEFHGAYMHDAIACMDLLASLGYTMASYVEQDIDLDNLPNVPMEELREQLIATPPNWGNITVR